MMPVLARRWRYVVHTSILLLGGGAAARAAFDPAAAFNARCSGCHSVGRGIVVGPDLQGVTSRHEARWLHSFIRSSQELIRQGDPAAVALFARYKKRMPDHGLTDGEIDALLAYVAAGGPAAAARVRPAAEATPAEVTRGRALFTGAAPLRHGGAACSSCHAAGEAGRLASGTLASDLTRVYVKYQDAGLARALEESEPPLMAGAYHNRPLTGEEIFALEAWLYQTARSPVPPDAGPADGLLFLSLGGSPLALWGGRRVLRQRRRARRNGRPGSSGSLGR